MLRRIILLMAFLSIVTFAMEDFENLKPLEADKVDELQEKGWITPGEVVIPEGWYISPYGNPQPMVMAMPSPTGRCLYIRGGFTIDSTVMKQSLTDQVVEISFDGKGNDKGSNVIFIMTLMTPEGKFISNHTQSLNIGKDWKNYKVKMSLPERTEEKPTKITPGFYSPEGAWLDNISIKSIAGKPFQFTPVPEMTGAIMDFEFEGIAGKTETKDRTGNYTMYSECGKFVETEHSLRTSFGSRFKIPCQNDAFGEAFTIRAWIDKASRGGIFLTPILTRGYMKASDYMIPDKPDFDFSLYVHMRLPGFATRFGGLHTNGHHYNGNIAYDKPEYLKAPDNKPLPLNCWQQIIAVYDHGKTSMYLNGTLIGENPEPINQALLQSNLDLYIGGFRCKGERDNVTSAEMLIKSLCVIPRAFSSQEVQDCFEKEKAFYPMDKIYDDLGETRAYFPEDMMDLDTLMAKRLDLTQKYFARPKPSDPFLGKKNIETEIESNIDNVKLFIDGRQESMVNAHGHINDINHRLSEFQADFAAAGVNLCASGVGNFWTGIDQYDWKTVDDRLELYVSTNPQCRIDVVFGINPPEWYRKQFPEELEKYYYHGELKTWTGHGSFSGSDKYFEDSMKMVHALINHIENSPYANHVYGYLISGGDAGEWYWPGQFSGGQPGYSEPTTRSFRAWLKTKYGDDASLQNAWNNPEVTFENAGIPLPDERYKAENLFFRDAKQARPSLDIRHYMQDRNTFLVTSYARAIKEEAPGKQLTVYYGYPMLYAGNPALAFSGLQTVGDILSCPDIDWIATPIDYQERRGGQAGVNIAGYLGSAKLHGKGIWREEDLRTHLFQFMSHGRSGSERETNEVIRRAYMYTIGEDYGMWYICQHGLHGYHTNGIQKDSAKMKAIADSLLAVPHKDISEVALIFDEKESLTLMAPNRKGNDFASECIFELYRKAHQMGTPFKVYLSSDIDNPKMPDYKLYIFLNQWATTPEMTGAIRKKLQRNHATALWLYAPGYISNETFSTESMKELTGIAFEEIRQMKQSTTTFTDGPFKGIAPLTAPAAGPYFVPKTDNTITILGTCDATPTMVERDADGFRSIWSLLPPNRELLTALCKHAGVHVFSEDGNTLLANSAFVALHTAQEGPFTITLPKKTAVTDCLNNKKLGKKSVLQLNSDYKGQTFILKY